MWNYKVKKIFSIKISDKDQDSKREIEIFKEDKRIDTYTLKDHFGNLAPIKASVKKRINEFVTIKLRNQLEDGKVYLDELVHYSNIKKTIFNELAEYTGYSDKKLEKAFGSANPEDYKLNKSFDLVAPNNDINLGFGHDKKIELIGNKEILKKVCKVKSLSQ